MSVPIFSSAPTFARPADVTQYASGDLVANSTTAGSVVALVFKFDRFRGNGYKVRRFNLFKSNNSITTAAFRLHLFSSVPTFSTNGDNSAISGNTSGMANCIGSLDVTAMTGLVDGAFGHGVPVVGSEVMVNFNTGSGGLAADGTLSLFGILEAKGTYTPASAETFTATIFGELIERTGN